MKASNWRARRWLLLSACAAFTLSAQTTASAQDADDEALEEIIVTGSRIRQNPLEARTPIMNLSEVDIDRSGRTSVADFLQQLAITGSAINAANNSSGNLGFPPDGGGIGAGQAEVDLRNLTSKRTLVLVDGRRWISGSSASGVSVAVDLNTIPLGAIERVEVLQDGASPIYGSDAIAGVVNIITKTDYDGLDASAYLGSFDEGDGEVQEYEISFGASTDRARVFLDVSFTKSEEVLAADRAISQFPVSGFPGCTSSCSSGTPQARIFFITSTGATADITLNDGVVNDGGANIPAFDPANPGTLDFHDFTTADRFNFQPFNFLKTPNTRINIFAKAEYDITDDITFKMTAAYNNRRSVNQAAPEPLFIGPSAGNGNLMDTVGVDVTNPFNPFGVTLDASNFVFAGRRPIEAGTRLFKQNVDTWTLMSQLAGESEFGGRKVYWDIGVSWSQAQANQRKFGAFNSLKLKQALGPLAECVVVDGDADNVDDFTGCTPFNFFGGQGASGEGSITQKMLDFVGFIQKDESQQQMFVVSANVSGDIFELPAGPVGYAFGYEHRKQEGFFTPDSVVTAGNTAGVPSFPTEGQFDVDEFYGELNVPLISDVPFAQQLDLSAAIRVSDYNLFGSDSVFKIGANWRVTDDLLIRGNFSEGFRAPGIGELFNTGSRFDTTLPDPCSDMLGLDPNGPGIVASATTIANCTTLGVPANGSYTQVNAQIGVKTGGNLALTPESSDSFTIGLVYDASWAAGISGIESLTIEANYYDISIDNAIQAPVALDQLTACVATLNASLCDGISRTSGGVINGFENQLDNIGSIDTTGFDWTVKLTSEEFSFGRFQVTWDNTLLDSYDETLQTATALLSFDRVGTELGSPERGFNKYKSTFILDWFKGDFSASYVGRYLSGLDEACPGGVIAADPTLCTDVATAFHRIPSVIYSDIQVTWNPSRFDNRASLTLGVNNVFDSEIPVCFTCDLNSFDGTLSPIPGQFGYLRLKVSM